MNEETPRRRRSGSLPSPASLNSQEQGAISPLDYQNYARKRGHPLRRVQRVGRHAALTTKQVVWDTNDASIHAALSAVDQWEGAYDALRGLLVTSFVSAKGLYGAAKEGARTIEHDLFLPVRDWILLPAFFGAEQAVMGTAQFLQSEQAKHLAGETLQVAKKVPVVGENFLAPAMCFSVGFVQRTWEILQYPIPSKRQVSDSVNFALNGTKWALSAAFREVFMYIRRADANITRTLSHTQWKVLGSGPYATLDKTIKSDVIDHICERYLSLKDPVARYELAAHIRRHNRPLYNDLVTTCVLKERGGELTKDDEWLSPYPEYRAKQNPFLLGTSGQEQDEHEPQQADIVALWFRLPYLNGKRPARDVPWVGFRRKEQKDLERRYGEIIEADGVLRGKNDNQDDTSCSDQGLSEAERYLTTAQWYEPDSSADVLVDQDRQAVSFLFCCPVCREQLPAVVPPMAPRKLGDICDNCSGSEEEPSPAAPAFGMPPLSMVMRPTFWRFHGPGDAVRRATWFLDTKRNGLQPFDEVAQAVLEDAYLFLNWISVRQAFSALIDGSLLTVEVSSPAGSTVLVHFSSLTHATAIQQGLGSAVAIFKRRVYRGAWLGKGGIKPSSSAMSQPMIEESILQAVEKNGTLGETLVPDVSIRSVLVPPEPKNKKRASMVLFNLTDESESSLAVPPSRLVQEDLGRFLIDHGDGDKEIDHLVLIVHGIGEMMRSSDVFGLALPNLSSIIDCGGYLRKNHVEVQESQFSKARPQGRVEYLPVEWHEAFTILSRRRKPNVAAGDSSEADLNIMLNDISLRTIPQMRDFANDALMDVLYFMSPNYHDVIVDVVTNEMNVVVRKFRQLTGFKGGVSVIGHSLGSIISWDIFANQYPKLRSEKEEDTVSTKAPLMAKEPSMESFGSNASCSSPRSQISEKSWMSCEPGSPKEQSHQYPQLAFSVDNFFLLGSPVAVFLMIRNQREPLHEDFYLRGCRRVFNGM
jgi:hypothetical protein